MAKNAFFVCLLSEVVYLTLAINVDIPSPSYEFARGDNATIPCIFTTAKPNNAQVIVTWSAHADVTTDPDISILTGYLTVPEVDVDSAYDGRASLQYDLAKGIANLQIASITSAETRVFTCKVSIPGDKTGKSADTASVVVLVAPSIPKCSIQGKAEYGQNISLTCHSDEGTPTPTYQWQSYDVRNVLRPNPPKSSVDATSGTMSLINISADTSGYYICTSRNKIRQQSCNLTLAAMPPSMNIASTAGIIGACVAGLILLIIIVCCCRHRNKKEKEEYAMGAPESKEYMDKEPHDIEEHRGGQVESKPENTNQHDSYDDRSERDYDRHSDRNSERRDDYDDRRQRYDDRRSDRYDDRQSDRPDDRRSDRYDDRRSDRYDDRRSDRYDDRRSDRYDDRDHRDDRRNERRDQYDDQRGRYDDRDRPALKPPRA